MKSSIKIDFADRGNGIEPVIKVKLIKSDDPRDGLLQNFFEQLGGESSWAQIYFDGEAYSPEVSSLEKCKNISIFPVKPSHLRLLFREVQTLALYGPQPDGTGIESPITAEELIRSLCAFVTNEPVKQEMVDKIEEALGIEKDPKQGNIKICCLPGCGATMSEGSPLFCPDHNEYNKKPE